MMLLPQPERSPFGIAIGTFIPDYDAGSGGRDVPHLRRSILFHSGIPT
jgi:hypothetical protein